MAAAGPGVGVGSASEQPTGPRRSRGRGVGVGSASEQPTGPRRSRGPGVPLPELATERLRLRPLRASDAEVLHPAYSDPDNLTWWHRPPVESIDQTRALVEADMSFGGLWAVCLAGTDEAIGHVGWVQQPEAGMIAGFGYFLRKEHWGNGYAAEASRAALDWGFDEAGIQAAELWIYDGNDQSVRVAEKLGARLVGTPRFVNVDRRSAPAGLVYVIEGGRPLDLGPTAVRATPRLYVPDVRAALDWYVETLGWKVDFAFGDPPTAGQIVSPGFLPNVALIRFSQGEPQPSAMCVLVVEGLDDLAERAGDAVTDPPANRPWGLRTFDVTDPWGNVIMFEGPAV